MCSFVGRKDTDFPEFISKDKTKQPVTWVQPAVLNYELCIINYALQINIHPSF